MHSSAAATIADEGVAPWLTRITIGSGIWRERMCSMSCCCSFSGSDESRIITSYVSGPSVREPRFGGARADVEGQLRCGAADFLLQDVGVTKVGGDVKGSHRENVQRYH